MNKDNLIITWLFLLMIFVVSLAWMADDEIDAVNKTLEALLESQETLVNENKAIMDKLSDIDDRLDTVEHNQEITDIRLKNHYGEISETQEKLEKIEKQKSATLEAEKVPARRYGYKYSEWEIRLMAKLVYLEAGSQSYRCQKAIASVIINRSKKYNKSIYNTIYEPGVFGPAYKVSRTTPSNSCLRAVREVVRNGCTLPRSVVIFRNRHYHTFGRRYCCIDGVYFSSM
ncbi:MAG: cell wall hydrolase [Oceanobacillus sp.]|nr:cell wall hydrolase [Oceanobacillus sp.]